MNANVDEEDERTHSSRIKLPAIDVGPDDILTQIGDIPQESALRVAKGSIGFASAAFVAGAVQGALRAQPAVLYGVNSGISTFAFAFPILALREYAVAPTINKIQRDSFPEHRPSLHSHNLIASTVSGAVAGGAMSVYFRGRQKLIAGVRTWAILSFGLQLLGNELRVIRVNLLSKGGREVLDRDSGRQLVTEDGSVERLRKAWLQPIKADRTHDLLDVGSGGQAAKLVGGRDDSTNLNVNQATLRKPAIQAGDADDPVAKPSSWVGRTWNRLAAYSPVKSISDADYEKRLLHQRNELVDRIQQLDERIIEDEDASREV